MQMWTDGKKLGTAGAVWKIAERVTANAKYTTCLLHTNSSQLDSENSEVQIRKGADINFRHLEYSSLYACMLIKQLAQATPLATQSFG